MENENETDEEIKEDKINWINLKPLLYAKSSYESAINYLKPKIFNEFNSYITDIYIHKIRTYYLTNKNKTIVSSGPNSKEKNVEEILSEIAVHQNFDSISKNPNYKKFLFFFRENNDYMIKLLKCLDKNSDLVPFFCHFFYNNFFSENGNEEILYIIYLLLEQEIDDMNTPSFYSFLHNTFLGEFLEEFANKSEIKNYIEIVLNNMIRDINEKNSNYYSLSIISTTSSHKQISKEKNTFIEFINFTKQTTDGVFGASKTSNILKTKTNSFLKRNTTIRHVAHNEIIVDEHIEGLLLPEFFISIDKNSIKKYMEKEKSEDMKNFFLKHIRLINESNNPNFYNNKEYHKRLKKINILSRSSFEQYKAGYLLITKFISELLTNLENVALIPYEIRAICKFIYILVKKKFKNLSKMHINSLVSRFLFYKLIFPVLENPDINNLGSLSIISINTRKNLRNISLILDSLVKGELFCSEQNANLTIFNKFIITNYKRINTIIEKIVNVSIPKKLEKLSEQFYDSDDFCLDKVVRSPDDINYKDDSNKFMNKYKYICFEVNNFISIYTVVHCYQNLFFDSPQLKSLFEEITKEIPNMKGNSNFHYYFITNQDYESDINQLYTFNQNIEKYKNIKKCIKYIFSNLELPFWKYKDFNTLQTFEFLEKHIFLYTGKNDSELKFCISYIIKKIKSLEEQYQKDNFQLLYNEIKQELENSIKYFKEYKNFLEQIYNNIFRLKKMKKYYEQEYAKAKNTYLNIKAMLYIEKDATKICLMQETDYNKMFYTDEQQKNEEYMVIAKQEVCPHKKYMDILKSRNNNNIQNVKWKEENHHFNNIKEFCKKFLTYANMMAEKVNSNSFGPRKNYANLNIFSDNKDEEDELDEDFTKVNSLRNLLEAYMGYIKVNIYHHDFFLKMDDKDKDKVVNIIWNYILNYFCNTIYETQSLYVNECFIIRCGILINLIKPVNLSIKEEVLDENILKKIEASIKHIDDLRTPKRIIEQFTNVVNLINYLFEFTICELHVEAGEILPLIIYNIVRAQPKNFIFNVYFTNFFISDNDLLGGVGYNMAQAESSINFLNKIEAKQLGISQKEFNKLFFSLNKK